jgi:hypothetical protein
VREEDFMRTVMEIMQLVEATKDPIARIAAMTDSNDHGGALLAAAEYVGAKRLAEKVKLVNKLHDLEGHLPDGLDKYRYVLHKELKDFAEKKLEKAEFERLWGAM